MKKGLSSSSGQSIVEFALILPLVMVVLLGVIELSYALLDEHVVTKLTREGSNLISRDTSLRDAATAMRSMSTRPVNFDTSSKVIFSVVRRVATTGASNFNRDVLYQRYEYGALSATSQLTTRGTGSFGPAPDYQAANSDNDTSLQLTNLPSNLLITCGGLYVTEIYTTHTLITPFDRFGISVPSTLYSIAYF
jgi:Flp pilus assembly protein TadG